MSTEPEISVETSDPSAHIRTYAKDFAAVSGKSLESVPSNSPIVTEKKVKQIKIKEPKIKKPKPVKPPKPPKVKKERKSKKDTSHELPIQAPPLKQDLITPPTSLNEKDTERLAILQRLKERAGTEKSVPEPTLASSGPAYVVPAIQTPLPPPAPAPSFQTFPKIVPSLAEPSPIHTYKTDFADRIDEKGASKFSVLAAEKDAPVRKTAPLRAKREHSGAIAIIAGVVLLLVGAGALAGGYVYMVKNTPAPIILGPASLISFEQKTQLSGSGSDLLNQLAEKSNQPLPVNTVLLTYIEESTTTAQGVTEQPATGGAFITELGLQAPDILLRNIDPSSMVGIVHAGDQTRPFFILRVDSYESTFAGMLQWEPTMFNSLETLYPLYPKIVVQVQQPVVNSASTTQKNASTTSVQNVAAIFTPTVNPRAPSSAGFLDEIVDNHSARVLKDNSGATLVLYGYADKSTLIIARDEAAYSLILSRLAESGN